jgi:hypothetical protein
MTKKKQPDPPMVPIHVEMEDEKGITRWFKGQIALTEEVVAKLRESIAIKVGEPDYTRMRLEAYEKIGVYTFNGETPLRFTKKEEDKSRTFKFSECRVIPPDEWRAFEAKMDLIDDLEKGNKE